MTSCNAFIANIYLLLVLILFLISTLFLAYICNLSLSYLQMIEHNFSIYGHTQIFQIYTDQLYVWQYYDNVYNKHNLTVHFYLSYIPFILIH